MTISTKEQLKEHIHSIHDFIRNNGAGYGMNALKIFMLFYGLKIIEPEIDNTPLNKKICKFSQIKNNKEKYDYKKENPLTEFIDIDILDEFVNCQKSDNNWYYYIFYQIPRGLNDNFWNQVINYVNEIPTKNNKKSSNFDKKYDVDLSGKVYEYFIGRDANAISDLGAYFTNRYITDYIMKKIKPTLDDKGNVKEMIDPFGGSGGFTLSYVQYINDNYNINWDKNIKNIYHYDMNEDVIKIAGLEMFGLTGKLPDKDENFKRTNTFKDNFGLQNDGTYWKFDYILSNPPYGGDKNKKSSQTVKNEKILSYILDRIKSVEKELKENPKDKELLKTKENFEDQIKNIKKNINLEKKNDDDKKVNSETCSKLIKNYIEKYDLKTCNDKEACSLVLFMALLRKNGLCAGVLKEGIFFDKKYSSVRNHLVKNFNVKYVISVPQDQFENTNTKTSILIFEKSGTTKEIIFYDLIVQKEKEDVFEEINERIEIVKCKDDVMNVIEKEVCRCKIEDMTDDYSLNYKKYLKNKVKCHNGFELVKLGDLLEYDVKSKRTASDGKEIGEYRFYTSSEKIKKSDCCDYEDDLKLIFGTGGKGSLFLDKDFSCSGDNFVCAIKNKNKLLYTYNYLKNSWALFINLLFNGSTLGHINKTNLNEYKIPFPKEEMMAKFEPILTKLMQLHERQQELHDEIPEKETEICDLIKKLTINSDNYEENKLKNICDIIYGSSKISEKKGKYPLYAGGINPSKYIDEYNINKGTIIISRSGNNAGNVQLTSKKSFLASYGYYLKFKGEYSAYYIYYYMKCVQKIILDMTNSTVKPNLNRDAFYGLVIKLLHKELIKTKLQPLFDEVDELKEELEENKQKHAELSTKFMKMINPNYEESSENE